VSGVYCLVSTVCCLLSAVYCLLSTVYCLLSAVSCLPSVVFFPLPAWLNPCGKGAYHVCNGNPHSTLSLSSLLASSSASASSSSSSLLYHYYHHHYTHVGDGACAAVCHQRHHTRRANTVGLWTYVHSCLLYAAFYLLATVCCLLSAVCCLLSAVCCLLSAVCCLLSAVRVLRPQNTQTYARTQSHKVTQNNTLT
jgi:hypothetical protein